MSAASFSAVCFWPFARGDVVVEIDGPLVSRPYVEMTLRMMDDWGLPVNRKWEAAEFHLAGRQAPCGEMVYRVEPTPPRQVISSRPPPWPAGALVSGLTANSLQGDVRFVDLLEAMGCTVDRGPTKLSVRGECLHGIDADMNDISDTVMTLAAVACFAEGPTTIRNVAHIRHKETDRLAASQRNCAASAPAWTSSPTA